LAQPPNANLEPPVNAMTYPNITLPELLAQSAAESSQKTALIYFGTRITYAELLDQVNRVAAGLQALGLEKGDRVALMMSNCPQFVISYFGALQAGAIMTATSSMYTAREITHQWNDAGAKFVIADRRLHRVIKAALPQLSSVRHLVLTGMRQYFPRHFQTLCRTLQTGSKGKGLKLGEEMPQSWRADGGRSALTPALSHPMGEGVGGAASSAPAAMTEALLGEPAARPGTQLPAVHDWEALLSVSNSPRPHGLKPPDVACLQYTGGTTGTSKGAMLTHANLVTNACQSRQWLNSEAEGQECMVAALPLFHIYAMSCIMITSVLVGGAVILLPRFEVRAALNVIRKYRPTLFHGVPTMYVAFINTPNIKRYGLNSLRLCTSGGAALPVEVRQKFESLTGGTLLEGYGLTESSPVTHFTQRNGAAKIGSIGMPIPQTEARIMDLETGTREMPVGEAGEIVIRGPQVMKGYWNQPEETARVLRDGWLFTGDIAKKDDDGYYYIVDRKKDMIIAGGFNIYPREVEEVLFECPQIKEAAVIGVPDAYRGETVKAFVVLHEGAKATAEAIMAFCRERLAAYKVPRQVVFLDALPKSAVGKYLRRELRKL
jgi:long-chain acyl-CoA synthetase